MFADRERRLGLYLTLGQVQFVLVQWQNVVTKVNHRALGHLVPGQSTLRHHKLDTGRYSHCSVYRELSATVRVLATVKDFIHGKVFQTWQSGVRITLTMGDFNTSVTLIKR